MMSDFDHRDQKPYKIPEDTNKESAKQKFPVKLFLGVFAAFAIPHIIVLIAKAIFR